VKNETILKVNLLSRNSDFNHLCAMELAAILNSAVIVYHLELEGFKFPTSTGLVAIF
jgi:hypothetical protein